MVSMPSRWMISGALTASGFGAALGFITPFGMLTALRPFGLARPVAFAGFSG